MRIFSVLVAAVAISGCAELNSIQYTFDGGSGEPYVATIDAKQRVIAVAPQVVRRTTYDAQGQPTSFTETEVMQVCAEQSPDVFSMFSSFTSLSGEYEAAAIKFATALVESGGSLAMRTQLTQAQANFLYNLCALSAAQKLPDAAVRAEMRRFQQTLLAALAIEQVTAPYRTAPQITVSGESAATQAAGAEEAAAQLAAKEEALEKAKTAQANAEKALNEPADGADMVALENEVTKQREAVKKATADRDLAKLQLDAIKGSLSAFARGDADVGAVSVKAGSTSDHVATIVKGILEAALNRGALLDNCQEFLYEGGMNSANPLYQSKIVDQCINAMNKYAEASTKAIEANADVYRKLPEMIASLEKACAKPDSQSCKAAIDAVNGASAIGSGSRVFSGPSSGIKIPGVTQ